jgi:hypothetical protein
MKQRQHTLELRRFVNFLYRHIFQAVDKCIFRFELVILTRV